MTSSSYNKQSIILLIILFFISSTISFHSSGQQLFYSSSSNNYEYSYSLTQDYNLPTTTFVLYNLNENKIIANTTVNIYHFHIQALLEIDIENDSVLFLCVDDLLLFGLSTKVSLNYITNNITQSNNKLTPNLFNGTLIQSEYCNETVYILESVVGINGNSMSIWEYNYTNSAFTLSSTLVTFDVDYSIQPIMGLDYINGDFLVIYQTTYNLPYLYSTQLEWRGETRSILFVDLINIKLLFTDNENNIFILSIYDDQDSSGSNEQPQQLLTICKYDTIDSACNNIIKLLVPTINYNNDNTTSNTGTTTTPFTFGNYQQFVLSDDKSKLFVLPTPPPPTSTTSVIGNNVETVIYCYDIFNKFELTTYNITSFESLFSKTTKTTFTYFGFSN